MTSGGGREHPHSSLTGVAASEASKQGANQLSGGAGMGKVVKFTGSKLLGEELRRLRGGRRLDDVVEMGRARLVPYGFKSVAASTLSEIENGRTLPNVESVFALSILYQVPTSRFLHLLLAENLLDEMTAPETPEELRAAYTAAVHGQRPTEALALATHALKIAAPGWETLRWRLNRATAIERLGMRWDAIAEMQEALDHRDLPTDKRYSVHFELSRMHDSAGQFSLAEMHLQRAVDLAPPELEADRRAALLRLQVRLLLTRAVWGQSLTDAALEDATRALFEAESLCPSSAPVDRLGFVSLQGQLALHRREHRKAKVLYSSLLVEARSLQLPLRQVEALHGLAELQRADQSDRAQKLLLEAAELAVEHNFVESAFITYFELHRFAQSPEQRDLFLRKCRRLYPLVQSSHPSVRAFEAFGAPERNQ